ncbi:MAG: hypothetical protein IKS32_13325 [Solobacterium sp.]|nr:hypothetical protein [Solobacterium sp.]
MTQWQKLKTILFALLEILLAGVIILLRDKDFSTLNIPGAERLTRGVVSYYLILTVFVIVMLIYGIRLIVFYFTMARFMTGGRGMLYRGILYTDLALYTLSLNSVPVNYIMIYLIAILVFAGAINLFQAYDILKLDGFWQFKALQGIVTICFAYYGFTHLHQPMVLADICAVTLIYDALMQIAGVFTPTRIITIP